MQKCQPALTSVRYRVAFRSGRSSSALCRCPLPSWFKPIFAAGCVLLALPILWLSGCGSVPTHRFRLVVEALVDGEIKSGYSVIEVQTFESGGWGPSEATGIRTMVYGEAAFVDLGATGNLIALMKLIPPHTHMIGGLVEAAFKARNPELTWKQIPKLKGKIDLPPRFYPLLVSFIDANDPTTARYITPDNIGAVLGPDVELKRIYIEMTEEPPSDGTLAAKLPWLHSGNETSTALRVLMRQGLRSQDGSIDSRGMFRLGR